MNLKDLLSLTPKEYEEKPMPLKKKLALMNKLKSALSSPFEINKLIALREELCSADLSKFITEITLILDSFLLAKIEDVYTLFLLTPVLLAESYKKTDGSHWSFIYSYAVAKFYGLDLPTSSNKNKILSLPYIQELEIDVNELTKEEISLYNSLPNELNLLKLQDEEVFLDVIEEKKDDFAFYETKLTEKDDVNEFLENQNMVKEIIEYLAYDSTCATSIIKLVDTLVYYFDCVPKEKWDITAIKRIKPIFLSRILFFLKESKKEVLLRELHIQKLNFNDPSFFLKDDFLVDLLFYSSMFYKIDLSNFVSNLQSNTKKRIVKMIGRFYLIRNSDNYLIRKIIISTFLNVKGASFIESNINNKELFMSIEKRFLTDNINYTKCINYIYNEKKENSLIYFYMRNNQIKKINKIKEIIKNNKNIFIKLILNGKLNLLNEVNYEDLIEFKEIIVYAFIKDPNEHLLHLLFKIEQSNEIYEIINNLNIKLRYKIRLLIVFIDFITDNKHFYIKKVMDLVYLDQFTLNDFINCCWRNNFEFNGFNMEDSFKEMENL